MLQLCYKLEVKSCMFCTGHGIFVENFFFDEQQSETLKSESVQSFQAVEIWT